MTARGSLLVTGCLAAVLAGAVGVGPVSATAAPPPVPRTPAAPDTAAAGAVANAPAAAFDRDAALAEVRQLLGSRSGRDRGTFTDEQNVFMASTLGVHNLRTPDTANVDLPLYTGRGPTGDVVRYIITEAADFKVARRLGLNFSPKLAYGIGTGGDQQVELRDGVMTFPGAIDFSPRRVLQAGMSPGAFPPAVAEPGAVADALWSGLVVLPSGSALNVMVVSNATGVHDRANALDDDAEEVNFSLADGYQGGDQLYYHLVTESSDPVAATIEQGVWSPRLAALPAAGDDPLTDRSARLVFAPTANGEQGIANPQRQGLNSTIADDDRAPNNVFPLDPDNLQRTANAYSPMWDAHVYVWTDAAIGAGQRRAVNGVEDLRAFKAAGLIQDAPTNMGEQNDYVGGLRASGIIINCPVIAQPFEDSRTLPIGPHM